MGWPEIVSRKKKAGEDVVPGMIAERMGEAWKRLEK